MKRNVERMKSFRMRSPYPPVGKQTHPKDRTIECARLRFVLLGKFHGSTDELGGCVEALKTRIVENLHFVVVNEWLADGGKVQKYCPQQERKIWQDAVGLLHGRYYVKVRRDQSFSCA